MRQIKLEEGKRVFSCLLDDQVRAIVLYFIWEECFGSVKGLKSNS